MELTQSERDSVLWERLSRYYTDRLATLRAQNDNDLDPQETARVRGQIREIRNLLVLGNEKPEFASPGTKKPPG